MRPILGHPQADGCQSPVGPTPAVPSAFRAHQQFPAQAGRTLLSGFDRRRRARRAGVDGVPSISIVQSYLAAEAGS